MGRRDQGRVEGVEEGRPHEGVIVDECVTTIENTSLYRSLAEGRSDVEVWDDNYSEDGWAYFSIVAFSQGTARKLAYVRIKGGRIQKRTYDENGDDQWVDAG